MKKTNKKLPRILILTIQQQQTVYCSPLECKMVFRQQQKMHFSTNHLWLTSLILNALSNKLLPLFLREYIHLGQLKEIFI